MMGHQCGLRIEKTPGMGNSVEHRLNLELCGKRRNFGEDENESIYSIADYWRAT